MKIKSFLCWLVCGCMFLNGCGENLELENTNSDNSLSDSSFEKTYSVTIPSVNLSDENSYSEPECAHVWQSATCTEPSYCNICGQTSGKPLGHSYSGEYCIRCGAINPNYKETIEVSYISMNQYDETIYIGKQITLQYSLYPDDATNKKVTWSSSDPNIAKVDQNGTVSGVSAGEATITVKAANGESDDCTITVKEDIAAKCSLTLPLCPITVNYYSYSGSIYSTTNVTNIKYQFEESYNGEVKLCMYFSGEKTYDSQGGGQSSSCKIGWKLYDADNYVVKDGTVYTTSVKMGEKYKDQEETVYLAPGTYRLEVLNVN